MFSILWILKKISLILLCFFFLACTKQEIKLNDGNTAPNERPITLELKKNYINRLYIGLLGRKSLNSEEQAGLQILDTEASRSDRRWLIASIIEQEDFVYNLFNTQSSDILAGIDTSVIDDDIAEIQRNLMFVSGGVRDYYLTQLARLEALNAVFPAMLNDSLGLKEMHQRMVNTPYYDDLNMGTENFVVSCFQSFFSRYPTNVELENASDMVDGVSAILFLEAGNHKEDFIHIFFNSNEYFEGQVRYYYQKFLFREPSTFESQRDADLYRADEDFKNFLLILLSSDEYFYN